MVAKHSSLDRQVWLHPGFEPGPDRFAIGPPAVQAAEEEEDDSSLVGILTSLDCRWNLSVRICTVDPHPKTKIACGRLYNFGMALILGIYLGV